LRGSLVRKVGGCRLGFLLTGRGRNVSRRGGLTGSEYQNKRETGQVESGFHGGAPLISMANQNRKNPCMRQPVFLLDRLGITIQEHYTTYKSGFQVLLQQLTSGGNIHIVVADNI